MKTSFSFFGHDLGFKLVFGLSRIRAYIFGFRPELVSPLQLWVGGRNDMFEAEYRWNSRVKKGSTKLNQSN